MCSINGDGAFQGDDRGEAIAIDPSGNISITGRFGSSFLKSAGALITWPNRFVDSITDVFVIQLTPLGVLKWARG
jgi:hypothetical protein